MILLLAHNKKNKKKKQKKTHTHTIILCSTEHSTVTFNIKKTGFTKKQKVLLTDPGQLILPF